MKNCTVMFPTCEFLNKQAYANCADPDQTAVCSSGVFTVCHSILREGAPSTSCHIVSEFLKVKLVKKFEFIILVNSHSSKNFFES